MVVSLENYTSDPISFGRLRAEIEVKNQKIQIVLQRTELEETINFLYDMGTRVLDINYLDTPFTQQEITQLINKVEHEFAQETKILQAEKDAGEQKEKKKYTNKSIPQTIKIINDNVDRIDQLLLIGNTILDFQEKKQLTEIANELKKIRL